MRISWTELAVKRIIGLIMTPEPCRENAARVPVVQLRPNPKLRLRDPFHEVARFQHLSLRSETTYGEWVVRHLEFHKERRGCPRCWPRWTPELTRGGSFQFRGMFSASSRRLLQEHFHRRSRCGCRGARAAWRRQRERHATGGWFSGRTGRLFVTEKHFTTSARSVL